MIKKNIIISISDKDHEGHLNMKSLSETPEYIILSIDKFQIAVSISDIKEALGELELFLK